MRAKHPIPPQCGLFYFEVTVVSKGRDGFIGIGFASSAVSLQRLPGWEVNSWGYHGDDGNSFNCSGTGRKYGPTYSSGDVIGCGIDFHGKSAFFTKNGVWLGPAFEGIAQLDKVPVYPCVGLRTPGEVVEVNFGRRPFTFDIVSYVEERMDQLQLHINNSSLYELRPVHLPVELILKHLLFNGYLDTARELLKSIGSEHLSQQDLERCELKSRIHSLLLHSRYDELLSLIQTQFTQVSDLTVFLVKCQKFVDLVRQAFISQPNSMEDIVAPTTPTAAQRRQTRSLASNSKRKSDITSTEMVIDASPSNNDSVADEYERIRSALEYGQELQDEYRNDEREVVQQKIIEIFSLLAYPNPLEVECVNHLFQAPRKTELFDLLNLEFFGEDDVLRRNMRHLLETVAEMQQVGDGSAAFVELDGLV